MATTPHALTEAPSQGGSEGSAVPRRSLHALATVLLASASIGAAISPVPELALLVGVVGALVALRDALIPARVLLATIAGVVILVPMRRYGLPINLPYRLEPYRILLVLIGVLLALTVMVDPRVRVRRLGFGGWLGAFVLTSALSMAPNLSEVRALGADQDVLSDIAALLTAGMAFVIVRMLLRRRVELHALLATFIVGAAFVGLASVIERRSGWNAIRLLDRVLPGEAEERNLEVVGGAIRFGRARAFGSAQHPVALGAELVMLLPFVPYLALHSRWPAQPRTRVVFWTGCGLLMIGGVTASVSRLAVVALAFSAFYGWRLRPAAGPALVKLGVVAVVGLLAVGGGAISDLIEAFQPEGGLVAEQSTEGGARHAGRLSDVERVTRIVGEKPAFGLGFSTRTAGPDDSSRLILDNAYFSRLVDTGVIGFIPMLGLLFVPLRRMARLARSTLPDPAIADLAAALACAFVAFAVSSFFYDTFAFFQPVLTFFALLAIAGWLVTDVVKSGRRPATTPMPAPAPPNSGSITGL